MKKHQVLINTYRHLTHDHENGDRLTLCINFSSRDFRFPKRSPGRKFEPELGIWTAPTAEKDTKDDNKLSGGIAFVDVPVDTMKHYVHDLLDCLQYSYTAGGATLKLKNSRKFTIKSKDKKFGTKVIFGDPPAERSYVVPVSGKIKLDTRSIQILMEYLTNQYYANGPF